MSAPFYASLNGTGACQASAYVRPKCACPAFLPLPVSAALVALQAAHRSLTRCLAVALQGGVSALATPSEDADNWYPIPGANRPSYKCCSADAGHWLKAEVTPVRQQKDGSVQPLPPTMSVHMR